MEYITFKNCESLFCTTVIYTILFNNIYSYILQKKKNFIKCTILTILTVWFSALSTQIAELSPPPISWIFLFS